jgi:hypothetical protein
MGTNKFEIGRLQLLALVRYYTPITSPMGAITIFWDDMNNNYYHNMDNSFRESIFDVVTSDKKFDINFKYHKYFYERFNPDNQYRVTHTLYGEETQTDCYLSGKYYSLTRRDNIPESYITKIEKI